MTLPTTVKVGAATYDVHIADLREEGVYGRTHNASNVIQIGKHCAKPAQRDTVMHEVLHAIFEHSGTTTVAGLDQEGEEGLIRLLAPWLLMLLRDNPKLVTYFRQDNA